MNPYLTVITNQPRQVCLFNAPRPLHGEPVDIGLSGFTVRVTDELDARLREDNASLDARPVRMVTPAQAIGTARMRLAREYGMDAVRDLGDDTLLHQFAADNQPCRILDREVGA